MSKQRCVGNYLINENGSIYSFTTNKYIGTSNKHEYNTTTTILNEGKIHRIIWTAFNGVIPDNLFIDHIDRNKYNNRLSNLRLASRSDNRYNAKHQTNNKLGIKNIYYNKRDNRFIFRLNRTDLYRNISLEKVVVYKHQYLNLLNHPFITAF